MTRIQQLGLPRFTYTFISCALIVGAIGISSAIAADNNAKVTLVYEHVLPNVPGKSIKGVLVEYGPGGSSPAHTHPKSAFIYATVLEGAIRSSVNDGPAVTYHAGQNFSEMPGDRHSVSENASKTEPAKLLAVFVVDTDEKELTTPYKNRTTGTDKISPTHPRPAFRVAAIYGRPITEDRPSESAATLRYRRLRKARPCGPELTFGTSSPSAVAKSI